MPSKTELLVLIILTMIQLLLKCNNPVTVETNSIVLTTMFYLFKKKTRIVVTIKLIEILI